MPANLPESDFPDLERTAERLRREGRLPSLERLAEILHTLTGQDGEDEGHPDGKEKSGQEV